MTEVLNPTPHWHSYDRRLKARDDDDDDGPPKLGGKKLSGKKTLAITNYGEDSDTSMPDLQDVSDSDESDADWSNSDIDDDIDDDDDDGDSESESGYDTDQEDETREMLREAMDAVTAINWHELADKDAELDPFTDADRKGNSFLKLLGSLRGIVQRITASIDCEFFCIGRMFSKDSKLKTATGSKLPSKASMSKANTKSAEKTSGEPLFVRHFHRMSNLYGFSQSPSGLHRCDH